MAMQECKRAILGKALEDLVARARSGKEPCRIGLMASGGEHSDAEFLAAASAAMSADPALTVVGVGPKPSGILPQGMDWIETAVKARNWLPAWKTRCPRGASTERWLCTTPSPSA
ncbi:MAG: hypothetical protein ACLSHC_06300 [Bilophila wadsworthia]